MRLRALLFGAFLCTAAALGQVAPSRSLRACERLLSERFLELQQEALLRILSVVDSAGAEHAISGANVYVRDAAATRNRSSNCS